MSRRRGSKQQRGYSLVELMFVVAITGFAITAVINYAFRSRVDLSRQEVAADLFGTNVRIGANLRADLQSADTLMVNYPAGSTSFTALQALVRSSIAASTQGAPAMVPFTMEPTATGLAEPDLTDTANALWGNELVYLAAIGPVSFTAQDAGTCSTCTAETVAVSRYQFVCVYLTETKLQVGVGPGALRLVQWRSQPVVDLDSAEETTTSPSTNRIAYNASTLFGLGYTYALSNIAANLTSTATAFYKISVASPYFTAGSGTAPATLPESSWAYVDDYDYAQRYSARPGQDYGRISRSGVFGGVASPYTLSIAYDNVNPATNPNLKTSVLNGPGGNLTVPKYALADNAAAVGSGSGNGNGFPGGFEVEVVGAANAREIYMRRVLMSSAGNLPGAKPKTFQAQEAVDDISLHNPF